MSQTYFIQSFLNYSFTLVIKSRGSHVQQQDTRVPDQRSSYSNPLFLPAAHLASTLPDQGVKFLSRNEKSCQPVLKRCDHL